MFEAIKIVFQVDPESPAKVFCGISMCMQQMILQKTTCVTFGLHQVLHLQQRREHDPAPWIFCPPIFAIEHLHTTIHLSLCSTHIDTTCNLTQPSMPRLPCATFCACQVPTATWETILLQRRGRPLLSELLLQTRSNHRSQRCS